MFEIDNCNFNMESSIEKDKIQKTSKEGKCSRCGMQFPTLFNCPYSLRRLNFDEGKVDKTQESTTSETKSTSISTEKTIGDNK